MQTVDIFDAKTQQIEPHTARIDANGDYVFESPSGRFLKYPSTTNPDDLPALFVVHEKANKGQVSIEEAEANLQKLMSQFAQPTDTEEKTPVES